VSVNIQDLRLGSLLPQSSDGIVYSASPLIVRPGVAKRHQINSGDLDCSIPSKDWERLFLSIPALFWKPDNYQIPDDDTELAPQTFNLDEI